MKRLLLFLSPALSVAGPAAAHVDPGAHGAFMAGATHPLFGPDHILAMVAVGLWAVALGGRALWTLPATFVAMMGAGFALALAGMPLVMVEPMILASVLILGGLIALAVRMPVAPAAGIVGALALFHGHAHGAEMGGADTLGYFAGFTLATALLHGAGVLGGSAMARGAGPVATRISGGAVALAGSALVLAG